MTVTRDFLWSLSVAITSGTGSSQTVNVNGNQVTVNAYEPQQVVAVIYNNGVQVTQLTGTVESVTLNGNDVTVTILFMDTSANSYTATEIDIVALYSNGSMTVSRFTNMNITKQQNSVLMVEYEIATSNSPSVFVSFALAYLVVPSILQLVNAFGFSSYPGIVMYQAQGVNGNQLSFNSFNLTDNGFYVDLTLSTYGGGVPTIYAYTSVTNNGQPAPTIPCQQCLVFYATVPYYLPSFSTLTNLDIHFGIEFVVQ